MRAAVAVIVVILVVTGTIGPVLQAQAPAPTPKFEAASVKPAANCGGEGRSGGAGGGMSPGRLHLPCVTVKGLISGAYATFANGDLDTGRVPPIEEGPPWIDSARYDINAKAEGNAGGATMMGPMMQSLLEDRFKLKVHRETREGPAYALTIAKGGPKLTPFTEGSCTALPFPPTPLAAGEKPYCNNLISRRGPNLWLDMRGQTLDEFCKRIGTALDRPVIDKTGIAGRFDFRMEFAQDETTPGLPRGIDEPGGAPAASATDPAGGLSIFTALEEKLRLKLVPAKGPREFLVIDHIERPSEN
jgi:uncharacterized protein (TIGR03435 family)